MLGDTRRRSLAIVMALAALMSVSMGSAQAAKPQGGAAVEDPERNSTAVTAWGWHTGATIAQITAFINQGYRIIDLELRSSSGPTFSVAYVRDSGAYDRTWWWYVGLTQSQVSTRLSNHNARLIDIETYLVNGSRRYAAVMVRNTGAAHKVWQWWVGQTIQGVSDKANAFNGRPIDIDRYSTSAGDRFAVILIKNTGVDAKGWWHYYNVTPEQIADNLSGKRLIDIERVGSNRFDVVMQTAGSEHWWWYYGQSTSALANKASQLGARIYKIEPYISSGNLRFAALLINDVNAETTRIRDLIGNDLSRGSWGFYVKRVGGSEVIGLQSDTQFEPASAIKAAHAVHALKRIKDTSLSLTSNVTWYAHPSFPARYPSDPEYSEPDSDADDTSDKDVCAYANDGHLLTGATYSDDIGPVLIKNMLEQSDNRATDGILRRFGFSAINATIAAIGMSRSHLWHRVGCPSNAAGQVQPWRHNVLTLRDITKLYERVQNGGLLGTGIYRDKFWEYMPGGVIDDSGALADMIVDEANDAGLSVSERNQFLSKVVSYAKGGSYGLCPDDAPPCNAPVSQVRTVGGIIYLPFKGRAGIVSRAYVYGRFLDHFEVDCTFGQVDAGSCPAWETATDALQTLAVQTFRKIVRDALATW